MKFKMGPLIECTEAHKENAILEIENQKLRKQLTIAVAALQPYEDITDHLLACKILADPKADESLKNAVLRWRVEIRSALSEYEKNLGVTK